ncbi:MAG: ATP phosphoribosyltransferase [Candidatus Pacebacteria bacterium]|nr:ATP phosphoribosyltransferase [Candidatus Paceibacterota bacterium]
MLQIALPNKGALSEETVDLVSEAGYRSRRHGRELNVNDPQNRVEFVFLRPRDIPVYVSGGIIDLGITGRDLTLDSEAAVTELLPLGFGKSQFRYAAPADQDLHPDQFANLRIATSYPNLVMKDLRKRGVKASIIRLDGAVEIAVKLGVADVIADVVQTGRTLVQAGLKLVGDPILVSEAVVLARTPKAAESPTVKTFLQRLQGIVVARDYAVVEYDVPAGTLDDACRITPGFESPTISPLNEPTWKAVKAMVKRKDINRIMDELAAIGAKGIMITDIRTCRL